MNKQLIQDINATGVKKITTEKKILYVNICIAACYRDSSNFAV
jgi:hypothetical protein